MTKQPKNKQLRLDSMSRVNPRRTHGFGVWGNPRVVMSIRVDKGLKKAFKEVAKAKFGSTCNPIESFMAGVVGAYYSDIEAGVNPCSTINIGEIKIERNLRERRKMDSEPYADSVVLHCDFAGCEEKAVGLGLYKGAQFRLCRVHLEAARLNRKVWKGVVSLETEHVVNIDGDITQNIGESSGEKDNANICAEKEGITE